MSPSRSSTLRTRARSSTAVTVRSRRPPSAFLFADTELVQSTTRTRSSRWSRANQSMSSRTSSGSKCAYRSRHTSWASSPADSRVSQLDGRVATNQGAQGRAWHPLSRSPAFLFPSSLFAAVLASCVSSCSPSLLILHCTVVWTRTAQGRESHASTAPLPSPLCLHSLTR